MKKRITKWRGFFWESKPVEVKESERKLLASLITSKYDEVRDERDPTQNDDFYSEELRVNVRTRKTTLIIRNW